MSRHQRIFRSVIPIIIILLQVNPQSLALKSGLQLGDGILQIGPTPTENMSHEQAKMEIIRSGNELDFIIQR